MKLLATLTSCLSTLVDAENRQRLYDSLRGNPLFSDEASERRLINAALPFAKSEIVPDVRAMANSFFNSPKILRQFISSHDCDAAQISDSDLRPTINACPSLFTYARVSKSIIEARLYSYLSRVRAGNSEIKRNLSRATLVTLCTVTTYLTLIFFRCDATFGASSFFKQNKLIRAKIADRVSDVPRMLSDRRTIPLIGKSHRAGQWRGTRRCPSAVLESERTLLTLLEGTLRLGRTTPLTDRHPEVRAIAPQRRATALVEARLEGSRPQRLGRRPSRAASRPPQGDGTRPHAAAENRAGNRKRDMNPAKNKLWDS